MLGLFFALTIVIASMIGQQISGIILLLCGVAGMILFVLRSFKYLVISKEKRVLKSYSIFAPFGKTIPLDRCIGIITTKESGIWADNQAVFLVNDDNQAFMKLSGLFYANFDQLIRALDLHEIVRYQSNVLTMMKQVLGFRFRVHVKSR